MKSFSIDCSKLRDGQEFWDAYLREVKPEHAEMFGRNLDAFNDALAGGPGFPGRCELNLVNSSQLQGIDGGHFLQHLREIASGTTNETVTVNFR